MTHVHLAEIWRYPVESMAGERLERAELGPLGLSGDRRIAVVDAHGRVVTARNRPRSLGHATIVTGDPVELGD